MELISFLFRYLQVKYDNSPEFTPRPLNQLRQEHCFGKSIFCSSITAGSLDGGGGWTCCFLSKKIEVLSLPSSVGKWKVGQMKWSQVTTSHVLHKCSVLSPAATVSLYRIIQSFLEVSPCHRGRDPTLWIELCPCADATSIWHPGC